MSNVIKTLDPTTEPAHLRRTDPLGFYRNAFEKIHRLCNLQLLVCPYSRVHQDESIVWEDYFKKLKRLYEMLSYGARFETPEKIRNAQILSFARNWAGIAANDQQIIDRKTVICGRIDEWQNWFQITLNRTIIPEVIVELRETREKKYQGYLGVHERWKTEDHRKFAYWLREEELALSTVLKARFARTMAREFQIRAAQHERTCEDVFSLMDPDFQLLIDLDAVFREAGMREDELFGKPWECLESEAFGDVPFVKISCHLFAALARRAPGRKKPPTKHPFNDVDMLAAYLPCCDGMFVDKEMHGLLDEQPLKKALNYGTKIFSLRSKEEFLDFLDQIESSATTEHLAKVREVYGDGWYR
ncbi:MAG: hypothetical protein ACFUZC_19710 [Chthoniobacteraceae bacterium]